MTVPNNEKKILMICTGVRGGMRAVVDAYIEDQLFERWNIQLIEPHLEGGVVKRYWTTVSVMPAFLFSIVTGKVSLVHCHTAMKGSFWRKNVFAVIAKLFRVPVILHLHGSEMRTFYESQNKVFKKVISKLLAQADTILVLSNSWQHYIATISPLARQVILPNYVRLPHAKTIPVRNGEKLKMLFLGIIGKRKGVYDLLQAMVQVFEQIPQVELWIGGNGEVEKAKQFAHSLGLNERVKFLGWVSGESKIQYLKEADIYILPSYNEGLPVSILEAMSWQLPVVTTTVGGIPELIDHETDGILVAPGDIQALQEAISRLAASREMRHAIGKAGRKRILASYSCDKVLPILEQTYHQMIYQKKSPD